MEGNRDCFNWNLNNICKEHICTKSIMLQHTENGQSLTCLMLLFFSGSIPQSTHHAASGSNHGNSGCCLTRTCCYIFSGLHLKDILHILCGRKASSKGNLRWSVSGAEERRKEQGIKRRKDKMKKLEAKSRRQRKIETKYQQEFLAFAEWIPIISLARCATTVGYFMHAVRQEVTCAWFPLLTVQAWHDFVWRVAIAYVYTSHSITGN